MLDWLINAVRRMWLEAELSSKDGVTAPATERRASYSATLEVLAP